MNKPLKFKNKKSKKGSKPKLVYVFADTAREYKEDRFYIKKKGS